MICFITTTNPEDDGAIEDGDYPVRFKTPSKRVPGQSL